ncbi:MAG: hypothetical protein QXE45_04480 [Thermoplasmata archaeon]
MPVFIGPSIGQLRRLLGGDPNTIRHPALEREWALMESVERPDDTAHVGKVRLMNWIERLLQPKAQALTWPWGTIALNMENIPESELGDVLAHELEHVRQLRKEGLPRMLWKSLTAQKDYLARPYEQEAFEAEARRPVRRQNIELK